MADQHLFLTDDQVKELERIKDKVKDIANQVRSPFFRNEVMDAHNEIVRIINITGE